jgi:phosphatidylglycerophosphatase C
VTRTVAAFDFDGTLTRRDTMLPFLASVRSWVAVAAALIAEGPTLARDRDVGKERVLARVLQDTNSAELHAAGARYAAKVKLAPEMQERLAWHRREGHEVVIVSASLDLYLSDIAARLGVDHVLCSTIDTSAAVCNGALIGGNCRGPEKAKRLRAWLGDGNVELWAYGDSSGDNEMLALADHPIRVKRGKLLTSKV